MKRFQLLIIMLCCLMLSYQSAWADDPNPVVFQETFDQTSGTGGHDGSFSGNIASSTIKYDNNDPSNTWSATKCGGADKCVKFGTSDTDGVLTTPAIALDGASYALLTFSAAGWADKSTKVINTLTITANDGYELSGDNVIAELEKMVWNEYTVLIKVNTSDALQLTFTGKRGFLDDVVVRKITTVPTPSLPADFTFFPKTTEVKASKNVTLTPANYTTAYYTTDGTTPSKTNGIEALQTTGVAIHGTTTVKAIAYVGDMQSEVVSKTYTQGNTVNGIAAFKALDNGTEVRLYLADNANARVLHGHDNKMYLRDNSGTLCLDFGGKATFNPAPAHNQHVAGWIVGKKQSEAGYSLLKLVATDNTTTDFLVLAAPVTEPDTQPTVITPDGGGNFDFSQNVGDWVVASNIRVGTNAAIENPFNTELVANRFEFRQLVDLSGIVLDCADVGADTRVAPVYYNGIKPVVYVVDENEVYVCPADNVENATVRLKRTLSKDHWNTFVVPFDITSFDGEIREYSSLDGKTMKFTKTDEMRAGIPYLVKPNEDITDPVYSNVTLTSMHASFVYKGGDYYFKGTYGPYDLSTDKRHMFLTTSGQLAYPQDLDHRQLKGMRAYIEMLNGTPAPSMAIEGDATGIAQMRNEELEMRNEVYDLQGRKVNSQFSILNSQLKKGLYIVNGKKIIIQ